MHGYKRDYKNKTKFAFTLAETLIILAIIGIVAAMTIPALINFYTEKVTISKVKKMNAILAEALKFAIIENGNVDGWGYENVGSWVSSTKNSQMLAQNLLPHLKIMKDCGFKRDCMLDVDYYMLNGKKWNTYTNVRYKYYYRIVLIDGSNLIIKAQGTNCNQKDGGDLNTCGYILYDVNGDKKPNTFGKDVFQFNILPNAIVPKREAGSGNDGNTILDYAGTDAANYIIKNGNMNYLHTKK